MYDALTSCATAAEELETRNLFYKFVMLYITLIIREILRALRPIFQNIAYFYPLFGPETEYFAPGSPLY